MRVGYEEALRYWVRRKFSGLQPDDTIEVELGSGCMCGEGTCDWPATIDITVRRNGRQVWTDEYQDPTRFLKQLFEAADDLEHYQRELEVEHLAKVRLQPLTPDKL